MKVRLKSDGANAKPIQYCSNCLKEQTRSNMSVKYAKRFEAVFLCSYSHELHLNLAAAAKVIKKSKKFVQK